MTTTRAHRLATMSTVASAFTAAVCSIFGDVLDAAPRARASALRESRKRRSSDTGSDTPAVVFFTPASRALARAAPCLAVIVLAALFTTARADGGRHLLQGEPVAAGRNAPTAGTVSAGAIFPWTFPEYSLFGDHREGPRLRSDRVALDTSRSSPH